MNAHEQFASEELPRRRSSSAAWIDALAATAGIESNPSRLLPHLLDEVARRAPDASALLSERETFTFSQLVSRSWSYAQWAREQGLKAGDCVALVMSNRPEYVAIWLGLSRLGVVTALINTGLAGYSLKHCLAAADPRHIIAEASFGPRCIDAAKGLTDVTVWSSGENGYHLPVPAPGDSDAAPFETPAVTIDGIALLIYTSGTTGLPKAARVSHRRVLNWALWFKGLLGNTHADRMYDCLPLYHSVGGIVAVAATLVAGGSTVIAPKFSASGFWSDIRRWNCTQFQYIGELCRYLNNAPVAPDETIHSLRVICGNGLRADVWECFRQRFAIPQIIEFYAATEGNFSLFNSEGKPGAIGRVPPFLRHRFPTAIVRFDHKSGKPARNAEGFCIAVETGEPGEAIGRIGEGRDGAGRFEGYTDPLESERKILRNVFEPGDCWFRTGDLMKCDRQGWFYFVDRIGDTFRWKGENVSTLEVANVLASAPGVRDAVVYGVDVPGADGKVGMALLVTDADFDLPAFRSHAAAQLPAHALPVFLRMGTVAATTETFKHRKQDLMREGFDPGLSADPVYAWHHDLSRYERLDRKRFQQINTGSLRL